MSNTPRIILLGLAAFMLAAVPAAPALAKHGSTVECGSLAVEVELTRWLSLEFDTGIQVCEVSHWRKKNISYGEIALAYGLAAESGRPVTDIMSMRQNEKMGWGKIAHRLSVNLSDAVHHASNVLKNANIDDDNSRIIIILDSYNEDTDNSYDVLQGKAKHDK